MGLFDGYTDSGNGFTGNGGQDLISTGSSGNGFTDSFSGNQLGDGTSLTSGSSSGVDTGDVLGSIGSPQNITAVGSSLANLVLAFQGKGGASYVQNAPGGNRPGATPNRAAGAQGTGLVPSSPGGWILAGLAVAAVVVAVMVLAKGK